MNASLPTNINELVLKDFPILNRKIKGKTLHYLDNAASTQKPQVVIDAISNFYSKHYANIHRGAHTLSEEATELYEQSRQNIANFINAKKQECIFVKGTTEAINLVCNSYVPTFMQAGDEVILSEMEHHANIVPWQMAAQRYGIKIKYIPVTEQGDLEIESLESLISEKTKIISVIHVSNTLGTINDIKRICTIAKKHGVHVLVDGAQAIAHLPVDVKDIGCDFYCFSGHKIYGPTGIGVLWGKTELLEKMSPYQGGGDMILSVSYEEAIYNDIPYKFEAGTPPIAEVIGLNAAINYLKKFDWQILKFKEEQLLNYGVSELERIGNVNIFGNSKNKVGIISFTIPGIHPHDIGTILDNHGVAIRTGHHCNMPLIKKFGLHATARASFALYSTHDDVNAFINAVITAKKMFRVN